MLYRIKIVGGWSKAHWGWMTKRHKRTKVCRISSARQKRPDISVAILTFNQKDLKRHTWCWQVKTKVACWCVRSTRYSRLSLTLEPAGRKQEKKSRCRSCRLRFSHSRFIACCSCFPFRCGFLNKISIKCATGTSTTTFSNAFESRKMA